MVKKVKKRIKPTKTVKKSEINEQLLIQKINNDAVIPRYIFPSDVGLDLTCVENISLFPMEQKPVKTGIKIKIPEGHVGLIRDRAGIVSQMNVHTAAGTFDPAYRGEISVILVNLSDQEVEIEKGMKIAQLIILPVTKVSVKEVKELDKTQRGEKGFGSTGIKQKIALLKKISKKK